MVAHWMLLVLILFSSSTSGRSPVIIVPGDGSNQLEAKLNKPSTPHWYCSKTADWYRLWLNTADLLSVTSCWADNIRLVVNTSTGFSTNAPGVKIRVPYFGSTESFEELDPSIPAHATAAFYKMVNAFESAGYIKNKSLRGAPYDFRHTPDKSGYSLQLRTLIEDTVKKEKGSKATLISHSMGGLQVLYFLRQQSDKWKARYIARWIPISSPWAGAAKVARLFASGDNEGLPVSASTIRDEQRSYETNHWLFPRGPVWADQPLVTTNKVNFTVDDVDLFFDAIKYPVGKIVDERVSALIPANTLTKGPGVAVLCLYSTGVDTPRSFYYDDGDYSKDPVIQSDDGDGTVNAPSLRLCEQWIDDNHNAPVKIQSFDGISHSDMIMDQRVIDMVVNASLSVV